MATTSLSASQEYRFEVAAGAVVTLRLTSGSAEMFGAELAPQRPYAFTGPTHEAVYTWHGCTFELDGGCQHAYVASETPMDAYLRLHTDLDARRAAARQADTHGPRVIVAGGAGSGKAALCRMLANWAARRGDGPLLVELDPLHQRHGDRVAAGRSASPAEAALHYRHVTERLGEAVRRRGEEHAGTRHSGFVASGCSWVDGGGYDALAGQISELAVDVCVVIGDDRLHSQLLSLAPSLASKLEVLKLPRSGGAR
ncbi:hypothetical protein EMIHUDRAFT_448862 [Emiliania huxleyi CCMP1516]|uniref:Zeta toxin domain-containing protein n=2 Tax=Emiliania huxleyi TaxID=2903 RepID=A0A0D3KUW3_EMIH1|nr:hypothetical protein EMIHUDRAFT_448862 [Emiliania huxleyi CCMP1516]EOD39548.1 hypothetical protein EMIHUDRAFT_448862 [Emiliania huxleyi CCMP1516]|eukprot:XP_005791977.1 hypothetical protein EMIHUDRAFT_448862 [Emiliania huxleyi CCMP1516]